MKVASRVCVAEGFLFFFFYSHYAKEGFAAHTQCVKYGTNPDGSINYVKGANVAGFMKVAKAMMAQGVI